MKRWRKYVVRLGMVALMISGLAYGFWPRPLIVDVISVQRGPLQVSVDDDGKTRIKERYVVAAPLAGRLQRIEWHAGDKVVAGQSTLAVIEPTDPELLDERQMAAAAARVRSAEAAKEQSVARIARAREAFSLANHAFDRAKQLIGGKTITRETFDEAEHQLAISRHELKTAELATKITAYELELAQAAFVRTRHSSAEPPPPVVNTRFEIRAPVDGVVLRVFQESEGVIQEGVPLLEMGDPRDLEVEIDVLSQEAARIAPGAKVWLEHWGGDQRLEARVRLIEPAAFLKISALGVEEQRVNVIADLLSPLNQRAALGDAFRVEARIVVWENDDVVKLADGALFRYGVGWATFIVSNGRAVRRPVQIGHSNGLETEIVAGLSPGDLVVLHPSDRLDNQTRVQPR